MNDIGVLSQLNQTHLPRLRLDEELWLDREGGGVREWEGPWLGRGMPTGPGEGLKPKVPL